jgi:ComF family protein
MGHLDRGVVCGLCWSRIALLPSPTCDRCGHPIQGNVCRWCELLPPFVRAVRSVCWMPIEPASSIVHALKYEGWSVIARDLAERMSRLSWPRDVVDERSVLVPVPLASARKRQRGYNQSALIAHDLGKKWQLSVREDLVARTRETKTQTRLTPEERRANVAGSFCIAGSAAPIAGAHVVIVDDVVTTAATLNSCAKVLYEAGARIISYVTFGRAHASGDRL